MWTTAGAHATIVTTAPHSGTYRLQLDNTSGKAVSRNLPAVVTSGTFYIRWYWQTNAIGVGDSRIFNTQSNGGTADGASIAKLSTGKIRLRNNPTATTTDSTLTISANTDYRFELRQLLGETTTGDLELRIYLGDATTPLETLSLLGTDTLPTTANIFTFTWEESAVSNSLTYLIDDIAINDDSGSFQTSWPGPGKTYLLVPDSNVSNTWEKNASGAANDSTYLQIDDLPGTPDDTDYNHNDVTIDVLNATGDIDRLGLTNLGAEVTASAVLSVIAVSGRIGSTQTSATHMRFNLWDESGNLTNGPDANANVNGWKITNTAETLVYNASAKSKANIDSFNVGYEVRTDTLVARPRRISALWVNVEWIEAPASTSKFGPLLGFF